MHSRSLSESASREVLTQLHLLVNSFPSDLLQNLLQNLLADCVVAPGGVVGRVLLARDHVLRVEEMFVSPYFDLRKISSSDIEYRSKVPRR